jgi:hypothetical protein
MASFLIVESLPKPPDRLRGRMNATIRSLNWDRYRRGRRDSSWTGVGQSVGNSGLFGYSSAGILDRCFQPQRVAPALLLEAFFDKGAKLVADLVGL